MRHQKQSRYPINSSKINPPRNSASNIEPFQSDVNIKSQNLKLDSNRQSSVNESQAIRRESKKDRNSAVSNYISPSNTLQSKKKTLQTYKYINQLARLEYEDKVQEVYTKFTKLSKATVMKKIKAKNQIAEFQDQDEDQNLGFDELIQFKFGKEKNGEFHFQNEEIKDYQFCENCDSVHNDHPEVHTVICKKIQAEDPESYSPFSGKYKEQSLKRIRQVAQKIKNTQYQQLINILTELQKITKPGNSIFVKSKVKLINDLNQLKQNNKNDPIFCNMVMKVIKIAEKK